MIGALFGEGARLGDGCRLDDGSGSGEEFLVRKDGVPDATACVPDDELSVLFACVNATGKFVCVIWLAETSNMEREGAKAVSRAA